jgi:hypothetical protein
MQHRRLRQAVRGIHHAQYRVNREQPMENENIKETLRELKEFYGAEREKLAAVDKLISEPLDREIVTDFWNLSAAEIEREMFIRLDLLDQDADCLPGGPISSHRSLLGKPIVFCKKLIRRLAGPYSSMLLQKQNRLNRELVTFQLLAFLKLRQLDKRFREMENRIADLPDPGQAETGTKKKTSRKP